MRVTRYFWNIPIALIWTIWRNDALVNDAIRKVNLSPSSGEAPSFRTIAELVRFTEQRGIIIPIEEVIAFLTAHFADGGATVTGRPYSSGNSEKIGRERWPVLTLCDLPNGDDVWAVPYSSVKRNADDFDLTCPPTSYGDLRIAGKEMQQSLPNPLISRDGEDPETYARRLKSSEKIDLPIIAHAIGQNFPGLTQDRVGELLPKKEGQTRGYEANRQRARELRKEWERKYQNNPLSIVFLPWDD